MKRSLPSPRAGSALARSALGLALALASWSCGGGGGPSHDGSASDMKTDTLQKADRANKLDAPDRKDTAGDTRPDHSSDGAPDRGTPPVDAARTDAARDAGSDAPLVCGSDAGAPPDGAAPEGSRIAVEFDPTDPEQVTNLQWLDSTSTLTPNLAASGGPLTCTDPAEFFGESYGVPEETTPTPVVAGHLATISWCGSLATITGGSMECSGAPSIPVTTRYRFYAGARASEVQVSRTFAFDGAPPAFTGTGLRPYVPRVPIANLMTVIYPNMAGTATAAATATDCSADCLVDPATDWNGKWFADVDLVSGLALIVLRDPGSTSPVELTINTDGFSASNLSSFVLVQPSGGWQQPITEVEYLCFADLATWPQVQRDAALLPTGCGP